MKISSKEYNMHSDGCNSFVHYIKIISIWNEKSPKMQNGLKFYQVLLTSIMILPNLSEHENINKIKNRLNDDKCLIKLYE